MALFPTNHTLTQGSPHYRLATLGYQKYNAYSVASNRASYHITKCVISRGKMKQIARQYGANHFVNFEGLKTQL